MRSYVVGVEFAMRNAASGSSHIRLAKFLRPVTSRRCTCGGHYINIGTMARPPRTAPNPSVPLSKSVRFGASFLGCGYKPYVLGSHPLGYAIPRRGAISTLRKYSSAISIVRVIGAVAALRSDCPLTDVSLSYRALRHKLSVLHSISTLS